MGEAFAPLVPPSTSPPGPEPRGRLDRYRYALDGRLRAAGVLAVPAAVLLVAAMARSGPAVATAATAAGLVPIVYFDLRERRIPTPVVYSAGVAVVGALTVAAALGGDWGRLGSALASAAAAVAVLALAWLGGAVGFGDVRLSGLVSLTAGWHGAAVVVAMWSWTAVALLVVALVGLRHGGRSVPLAPALALGWVAALVGMGVA